MRHVPVNILFCLNKQLTVPEIDDGLVLKAFKLWCRTEARMLSPGPPPFITAPPFPPHLFRVKQREAINFPLIYKCGASWVSARHWDRNGRNTWKRNFSTRILLVQALAVLMLTQHTASLMSLHLHPTSHKKSLQHRNILVSGPEGEATELGRKTA